MRPEQIKNAVSKLGLSEKLLLVEDIWDSIATNNSEIPMPMWQKRELDRRYEEYRQGKLELHNWGDVHKGLREKYKTQLSIDPSKPRCCTSPLKAYA